MSEKRLISFETLGQVINMFKISKNIDLNDIFDELPPVTLENIQGNRTLDSMTEEEVKEFDVLMDTDAISMKRDEFIENFKNALNEDADVLKVFKFLIEKGFKVF